jgi:uncharacterized protein
MVASASGFSGDQSPQWPDSLDVAAFKQKGWRPKPFQQFVVKVHSRCNLACDYCYMYEMADQSWKSRSKVMDQQTVEYTCHRIAEHAHSHGLSSVHVALHGGEPLLAGTQRIEGFVHELRRRLRDDTRLQLGVQTNGLLLDDRFLDVLATENISVGVSLDGDRAANDRHRRYTNGRGSYDEVAQALALLSSPPYRHLFRILLCTINLENDPLKVYEELTRWAPPSIDFLLPHGTWMDPPPQRVPSPDVTPYADWLIPIFERWYSSPRRETRIRIFESIIREILGKPSTRETFGLGAIRLVVVETDGSIEQVDTMKSTYEGAPDTGLNVVDHPFDLALEHPSIVARQIGIDALCKTCQSCDLREVCGAGLYPHRYREGAGFLNPSVYCPDLMKLINHIKKRVQSDLLRINEVHSR